MIEINLAQTVNVANDSGSAHAINVKCLFSDKATMAMQTGEPPILI